MVQKWKEHKWNVQILLFVLTCELSLKFCAKVQMTIWGFLSKSSIEQRALFCQIFAESWPQVGSFMFCYYDMKKFKVGNGAKFKFHFPGVFVWLFVIYKT